MPDLPHRQGNQGREARLGPGLEVSMIGHAFMHKHIHVHMQVSGSHGPALQDPQSILLTSCLMMSLSAPADRVAAAVLALVSHTLLTVPKP